MDSASKDRLPLWNMPLALELTFTIFFTARLMLIPIVQQYAMSLVAKRMFATNTEVSMKLGQASSLACQTTENATVEELMRRVEEEGASLILKLNIAELLPAVLSVALLGTLSDATGRRKMMLWAPCIGNIVYTLGFALNWSENSDWLLYLVSIVCGISGGTEAFVAGGTTYIIETVSDEVRMSRLAIIEFCIGLALALSNVAIGFWIQSAGFSPPLWFTFALSVVSLFIIIFLMKESNAERGGVTSSAIKNNIKYMFKFLCFTNQKEKVLFLVYIVFEMYTLVHTGQDRTNVMYLHNRPFCFSSVTIGYWLSIQGLIIGSGATLAAVGLGGKVPDVFLALLGFASRAITSLWMAFARTPFQAFAALPFMVFQMLPWPILRTLASRNVQGQKTASLFAMFHCTQALMNFVGPLILNTVYLVTLHQFPGTPYIICACLMVLCGLPLWLVHNICQRDQSGQSQLLPKNDSTGTYEACTDESGTE